MYRPPRGRGRARCTQHTHSLHIFIPSSSECSHAMATCSSLHTRLQIKGAPHLISSQRNSYISLQSKLQYNSRRNSGDSIKIPVPSAPWLGLLTKDKKLSLYSVAADINQATTNSTDTESGNPEKTPTSESIPKTLESPSSNGGVVSSKSVKRSSLTAREKLRAARVLKRVDTKPTKSEFGSKVLDALRESERGKKRSRLPEAPSNMLDDSKRGMPKQGLTFDFPETNEATPEYAANPYPEVHRCSSSSTHGSEGSDTVSLNLGNTKVKKTGKQSGRNKGKKSAAR